MNTLTKIYVWPDHSWCLVDEFVEHEWADKGDDYYSLGLPDDVAVDCDLIDLFIKNYEATVGGIAHETAT